MMYYVCREIRPYSLAQQNFLSVISTAVRYCLPLFEDEKMSKKILLADVPGFSVGAVKAGIKKSGNLDLGLIVADGVCAAAGVFTQNKVCAAPVKICRLHLRKTAGSARAVLVNAGNATSSLYWRNFATRER